MSQTFNAFFSLNNVNVAIGSTTLSDPLETISGTFTTNPSYNSNTISNDYAVIKLAFSATPGNTVTDSTNNHAIYI